MSWAQERGEYETRIAAAEERSRCVAERYALATAAAGVGVWDWNLRTGEFYLDPNIKALLGYEDHEIPNDVSAWATYVHDDDRDAVMKAAQDAIDGRTPDYVFEHRMQHKDGSIRWFMVRGRVVRDGAGKPLRFVGTDTDITERRLLEQSVSTLANEAQARIGHDLHESVGRALESLGASLRELERTLADAQSPHEATVREAAAAAHRAMQQTDVLARGLSPVIGISGPAKGLAQLAEHAKLIYGVRCRVALPRELPRHLSGVFANHLYRIAQEAIANAAVHGKASTVDVEGRIFNQSFLLTIADDGRGIAEPPSSSGMGLRIMGYRARELGGSLRASRRRDGGTIVVCSCPLPKPVSGASQTRHAATAGP